MKQHLLFIAFLLTTSICFSQSKEWKSIDTDQKNSVQLRYQLSDGTLIGSMTITEEFVISTDMGVSWSVLNLLAKSSYTNFPMKSDALNNLYYFEYDIVYKLNKQEKKFEKLIDLNNNIYDIGLLTNGNIIIVKSDSLLLYSNNGIRINSKKLTSNIYYSKLLLGKSSLDKNYLKYKNANEDKLIEFESDFSFFTTEQEIAFYSEIFRVGNRLISHKNYSDDGGKTWKVFSLFTNTNIDFVYVDENQKLFISTYNKIYMSDDGGENFTSFNNNYGYIKYISSANGILISRYSDNCISNIIRSDNNGQDWIKIKNDIGNFFSYNIAADVKENLFNYNCGYYSQRDSSFSNWREVVLDSLWQTNIEFILPLSNGELIASNYPDSYKSDDNGKTWNKIFSNFWYYEFIKEKKGILYYNFFDTIGYSVDFGESWNKIPFIDSNIIIIDGIQFSENYIMYYFDFFSSSFRYNILTNEIQTITPPEDGFEYCTSFSGDNLYVLSYDYDKKKLYINSSFDQGLSFNKNFVGTFDSNNFPYAQIKTDHLGNIYIWNNKTILISSDQGSTWQNITPDFPELVSINNLQISYDNYIYLATTGMGILKYKPQLAIPKQIVVAVYDDLNYNCTKDTNEPAVKNVKVVVNDSYFQPVDDQGTASFYVHRNDNSISLDFNQDLYSICATNYAANFDETTNVIYLDIPLKAKKYCADLKTGISVPFLRRCFDNTYSGSICNVGNLDAENVELKILLDQYFNLVSESLPIISQNGNELILNAGTIVSGDCKDFNIKVNVSCDAALGQQHCVELNTETSTLVCDQDESRDRYKDCQPNIGSFDPNDKAIFVNGVRNQTYLEPGDKLEYMIRFQNTGTDTAFTVKIKDPISSKFDIESIRPVAASHDYKWSIENGNLIVVFSNIMLVDSFKNEANSHGFIKFEIVLDNETKLNEEVTNVAGIYFDFNDPVITNTVKTPVGKPLSTQEHNQLPIQIFPNPTPDFITIKFNIDNPAESKVLIFNAEGKNVLNSIMTTSIMRLDLSSLTAGNYLVQIVGDNFEFKDRVVKL